jgi:phosphoglycerate dehydrogenase-like enzyme
VEEVVAVTFPWAPHLRQGARYHRPGGRATRLRILDARSLPRPDFEANGAQFRTLDESDFVVLTCPLTAAARGLITIEKLRLMKKTAILVNIAGGPVVVTADLVTTLRTAPRST